MVLRLKEIRKNNNMTIKELAQKSKIAASTISNFEKDISEPTLSKIYLLAKALGVHPAYLAGWSNGDKTIKEEVQVVYDHQPARLPPYWNNDNDGKLIK